jgi:small subunit ribosomal protein S6
VRTYETTFVVNPQTDNATIDQTVRAVGELITSSGGKIIKESHMGTRKLAYPILGLSQGYYATFYFESEPAVLPILERHFKLEEPYVRHLLIRFDGDPRWLEPDEEERDSRTRAPEPARPVGGGRRPEGNGRREEPKPVAEPEPAPADTPEQPEDTKAAEASTDEASADAPEQPEDTKAAEASTDEVSADASETEPKAPAGESSDEKATDDLTSGGEL